jgi:hypothetical protein
LWANNEFLVKNSSFDKKFKKWNFLPKIEIFKKIQKILKTMKN